MAQSGKVLIPDEPIASLDAAEMRLLFDGRRRRLRGLALQTRRGWSDPIPRPDPQRLADDLVATLGIRTPHAEKAVGDRSDGNRQEGRAGPLVCHEPAGPDPR